MRDAEEPLVALEGSEFLRAWHARYPGASSSVGELERVIRPGGIFAAVLGPALGHRGHLVAVRS